MSRAGRWAWGGVAAWPGRLRAALAGALLLAATSALAVDLEAAREAAAAGDAEALFELGTAFEQADGTQQDLARAMRFFELAAARGHAAAQYRLGVLLLGGIGAAPDPAAAYRWLSLAAEGEGPTALLAGALRDAAAARLDEPALEDAQAQVAAFAPAAGPAELPPASGSEAPPPPDLLAALIGQLRRTGCGEARIATSDGQGVAIQALIPKGSNGSSLDGALQALAAQQPVALDLVELEPGLCEVIQVIETHRPRLAPLPDVVLRGAAGPGKQTFEDGDHLVIEIPPQPEGGYVWIDYFVHDGDVLHMLPTGTSPDNFLAPGQRLVLGEPEGTGEEWQIGPPFGRDLLVVSLTKRPLYEGARAQLETAQGYLEFLRRRFSSVLPDDPIRVEHRVVQTVGK